MKQLLIRRGKVSIEDVPAPPCGPGQVLVETTVSCISAGTELSGIQSSGRSLLQRALADPAKVKRVAEMALGGGLSKAREAVRSRLDFSNPTGYSLVGRVIEVGDGVLDLNVGDRVACAGNQWAYHAEIVAVPRNMACKVPAGLDDAAASTATLGAIAMQGVRRLAPTLGETFVVVGLGILGQLTAQLLQANGCTTIGIDLDRTRLALATELGLGAAVHPDDGHAVATVERLTGGIGADGVIVTAAGPSDAILSEAFRMCRKKGRVVLVGDVGMKLDREDIYTKELDFLISTSYGPGRYDRSYEEDGHDYPLAYVRWTEARNIAAFLDLAASGRLDLAPLITAEFPLAEADEAYAALTAEARPLITLLRYPGGADADAKRVVFTVPPQSGPVRLALAGPGNFARDMHLPNIAALPELFTLRTVVGRNGVRARETARLNGAAIGTTDFAEVLADADVNAVLVSTRHDTHAQMALAALAAGKHVFVEKPLALTTGEVDAIAAFYDAEPRTQLLMTGYNRRFSSYAVALRKIFGQRTGPLMMTYRMNAGYVPKDDWVHGAEGGGRNLGEACHIYDLFLYLADAGVADVQATAIPAAGGYLPTDNFSATLSFKDGSVANLVYTAMGDKAYPKEHLEVFGDGKVATMENYQKLELFGAKAKLPANRQPDKGHREALAAFGRAVCDGGGWPIPLWQQLEVARVALAVEKLIRP